MIRSKDTKRTTCAPFPQLMHTGFHRPLRVVPPSANAPSNHETNPEVAAAGTGERRHHQHNGHVRGGGGGGPRVLSAAGLMGNHPPPHHHYHQTQQHPVLHPVTKAPISAPFLFHGMKYSQPAPPAPPPYSSRTAYFPSHFFPEKMYQYWQYYYPRLPPGKKKCCKYQQHTLPCP